MSEVGEDDGKGMVNDIEGVHSLGGRKMLRSISDGICVCVAVVVVLAVVVVVALMVARRVVVLMVVVGIVVLVMVVRVLCIGVLGVVGVLYKGALEMDCAGAVGILVLGGVFVVEVAEGVELVLGYVVRLILWWVNGRVCFLCCFSLMLVEMNGLKVGGFYFGMVIWKVCFDLLERGFLRKMVDMDMLIHVVVKVVVVEAVDDLEDMMGVRGWWRLWLVR